MLSSLLSELSSIPQFETSSSYAYLLKMFNCRNLNWDLPDVITWPIFMVEHLLIHGPALRPGFDLCKLNVIDSGYYKQPAPVKIEILRCLCNDVIEM